MAQPISLESLQIIKKDGSKIPYDNNKIQVAIQKSAKRTNNLVTDEDMADILEIIEDSIKRSATDNTLTVIRMHELVQSALRVIRDDVYTEYARYRNYKLENDRSLSDLKDQTDGLKNTTYRENGNKNSDLIATKRALLSEMTMKKLVINYELDPALSKAHNDGDIYIHDLGDRWTRTHNCCLFDMANLLRDKPEKGYAYRLNNMEYQEPKTALTALSVMGDMILSASSNQYGGFSVVEVDSIIAPYADKSYNTHLAYYSKMLGAGDDNYKLAKRLAKEQTLNELKQGYQSIEYKLNSLSNALGQTPFVTFTFGFDTSFWGREFTKAILTTRMKTDNVVFPKLVMYCRKEINTDVDSPNYDLFVLANRCTRHRIYPDYLSFDSGFLAETYERSGKCLGPMGCRSFLSFFKNPITGEEIYTGRANVSVVSVHLVKYAIEANGDWDKFYELLDANTKLAIDANQWYHGEVSKLKGSSNPLFWVEGGAWMSVGMDDDVAPIVKGFTASIGFVGLNQALRAMGVDTSDHKEAQKRGIDILNRMNEQINRRKEEDGILYSLYATPAESLCYTFNNIIRKKYGIIPGVSDKDYQTNSFHIDVWDHVSAPEKILYEAPFHQIAQGGHIGYVELPYGVSTSSLEAIIKFAMDQGMYFGANVVSSVCANCNEHGDFIDECPNCKSKDINIITRVCGYLAVLKRNGEYRQNPGKIAETMQRVDHAGFGNNHTSSYAEDTGVDHITTSKMDQFLN